MSWQVNRGRNDLTVNGRLIKEIEEKARRHRWNPDRLHLAFAYADSLIFGNGSVPRGSDRSLRTLVQTAFVKICHDIHLEKGILPGQNQPWYDHMMKTVKAN